MARPGTDFQQIKLTSEAAIRAGQLSVARQELIQLKPGRVPRAFLTEIGNLCRRAGLFNLGLRLLRPVLRPERALLIEATSEERAAYAMLLVKLGLVNEALSVLKGADQSLPEATLYTAFAHMNRWDYRAATPLLKRYLSFPKISSYQMTIARVNLAACLISLRDYSAASLILGVVRDETRSERWSLLGANASELMAQISIHIRDWGRALEYLQEAKTLSRESAAAALYQEKWHAILQLRQEGASEVTLAQLSNVRRMAEAARDWETVRDCDYNHALAARDSNLLSKVFFGTPHSHFRSRIKMEAGDWFEKPTSITLEMKKGGLLDAEIGESTGSLKEVLAVETGRIGEDLVVAPGELPWLLLRSLVTDFYRPQTIGTLYSQLFPSECFDPAHSPKRVYQQILKVRDSLGATKIPLTVLAQKGEYRLSASAPCRLSIGLPKASMLAGRGTRDQFALQRLKDGYPYRSFSSSSAAKVLGISVRSAKGLLSRAHEERRIYRTGNGRSTLYRFAR